MIARAPGLLGALFAFLIACLATAPPGRAADPQFPALTGRVVDDAGLLTPAARDRITGWLEQFEHSTKRQVVVVTLDSLQGYPIEDFGYRLGRFWGIGEKGKNTGVLLIVAPHERRVRIEVGYGLEGELTDAASSEIIDQDILPRFKQGDYEQGILAGTAAILKTLGWSGATGIAEAAPQQQPRSLITFIAVLAAILAIVLTFGRRGRWMVVPMGRTTWGSQSGSGWSSGGGFSGGGFSGGGGSFGGGGASGGW